MCYGSPVPVPFNTRGNAIIRHPGYNVSANIFHKYAHMRAIRQVMRVGRADAASSSPMAQPHLESNKLQ
jgi:hypothetical protein